MTTKKEILTRLRKSGMARKQFPGPYYEDREAFIVDVKRQLMAQGASESDIQVDDCRISIGSQFWWLPLHSREGDIVKVHIRSKDIVTIGPDGGSCYGAIKDWRVSGDGLVHEGSGATLTPLNGH